MQISPAEVAAGAPSVEVAADAYLAKNQDPEADGGPDDKFSLAPTDPEAPPMSVGQWAQQNEPTVAERIAQGWCESCVRGRGGCVRGRGRDHPHEVAGLDEGYPILASFKRLFLLQSGEGGHQVQKQLARSKLHDGAGSEFKGVSSRFGGRRRSSQQVEVV